MASKYRKKRKRTNIYERKYRKRLKKDRYGETIIKISAFVLLFLIILGIFNLYNNKKNKLKINVADVSAFNTSYGAFESLKNVSVKYNINFPELLTYYALTNDFFKEDNTFDTEAEIERKLIVNYSDVKATFSEKEIEPYLKMLTNLMGEIEVFPIPRGFENETTGETQYMYGNSWGSKREYGGERIHMGVDILDRENVRGRIPIVSMTSGIVENIGWNELGGYRVGITSKNGTYYYYAHLNSYKEGLVKGSQVFAGDVIGYMGDTGYSKKEGTTGNFVVHLHVGISPKLSSDEFWINPYVFLRNIEANKVTVNQ